MRSAPWTKKGGEETEKEPVKRREIGCPKPGPVDDEKLLIQEEISETRAFALPGLSSLAIVDRMWAKATNRFSMAGEVRKNCHSVQGEESLIFS